MPAKDEFFYVELWEKTISQIKTTLPESEFVTWFSRLVFGKEEGGTITLYTTSTFVKEKFEETYKSLIENTISELGDKPYFVKFEVKKDAQKPTNNEKNKEIEKNKTSLEKNIQKKRKQKI